MLNRLENLPNEILLLILNYIRWFEMIESFWSLNKHFNNLIYLKLSMTNYGIVISEKCFSFNHSKILRFVNLKKIILKQCYLTIKLIENLSFLIQYQLDVFIFTFDEDIFELIRYERRSQIIRHNEDSKLMFMLKEFLCKLFSDKCQLTSLELDIPNDHNYNGIHECLSINNPVIIHCITLRHLHVHLIYGYFLEDIIKYVPALQTLSVTFKDSLIQKRLYEPKMKRFISINSNWYEKMPKLKSFSLKSIILNDCELNYLKWIINNVYHVEKLKIRLVIKSATNENNIIDINYLRKNIMPDILINLLDFDFYIVSKCKLLFENDIEKIIDSFKSDRIFIDRHWTNVQCYFDRVSLCQHISSNRIIKPKLFHGIIDYRMIFDWEDVKYMKIDLCPSIYSFLSQFDKIYPRIRSIQFNIGEHKHVSSKEYSVFLQSIMNIIDHQLTDIHFRYVTRLDFGSGFWRDGGKLQFYI
ncbi:unnamed protein product [Rotaria sp. Silwood1]|nr:unnamed protein product [Rotaria sp. Silwood1]CAF1565250.1 unnamed protein product [Rotaria sp. Silwood1]CAF1570566.1 unnamed protein product [Rotaria sp. Silwood1]CAF3710350.1 unnamed protein product [Rotaria sp. Silwood1]CAF3730068.1 unnamed protein product [Rotaria sp. Silwood1]